MGRHSVCPDCLLLVYQVVGQTAALHLARLRAVTGDSERDLVRPGLGGEERQVADRAARHLLQQLPGLVCPLSTWQGRDLRQAAANG